MIDNKPAKPLIRVILADDHAVVRTGIRQFLEQDCDIQVIGEASDDDPYISAVLKTGANGYVLKTASPEEMINAVRDVYQGKSVLDATILPKVLAQIAHPDSTPGFEPLTDREIAIRSLTARGKTNKF
jgi:DNA-binding NarL/FixJ family response regulator